MGSDVGAVLQRSLRLDLGRLLLRSLLRREVKRRGERQGKEASCQRRDDDNNDNGECDRDRVGSTSIGSPTGRSQGRVLSGSGITATCSAMYRSCFSMRSAIRSAMRVERSRRQTRGVSTRGGTT